MSRNWSLVAPGGSLAVTSYPTSAPPIITQPGEMMLCASMLYARQIKFPSEEFVQRSNSGSELPGPPRHQLTGAVDLGLDLLTDATSNAGAGVEGCWATIEPAANAITATATGIDFLREVGPDRRVATIVCVRILHHASFESRRRTAPVRAVRMVGWFFWQGMALPRKV